MSMLTKEEKSTVLERKYTASYYAPWSDAGLFQKMSESLAEPFQHANIQKVLGLEARGFVVGAPVAYLLHAGFVVARKAGNLYKGKYASEDVLQETCIDYSGQTKVLEMVNALRSGSVSLLVIQAACLMKQDRFFMFKIPLMLQGMENALAE